MTTTAPNTETPLVYTVATLAAAIDKSPQFVRNAIKANRLPAKKEGQAIFIFPEQARAWIDSMRDA